MKYSEIMKNAQDFTKKCAAERNYKKYLKAVETERNLSTLVCPTCLGSGDSTEFEPEEKLADQEIEFDHLKNQYRVGNQFFDADMVRDMMRYPASEKIKLHQELAEKSMRYRNMVDMANMTASPPLIKPPGKPDVMFALGGLFSGGKKAVTTSSGNTAGSPLPPNAGSIGGMAAQPGNIIPAIWSTEIINNMAKQMGMGSQMNMPFSKPRLKPCPDCCGSGWGTTPDQPTEQGE